ncbi:MAG: PilZ domain-containing protein [Magnetococcales bacterium]|nr:PilZ domain-containing protein [Magnetococcales bacterium]
MINVKTKRQIRKPRNIVEIMMLAIEENALVDVIIQPAGIRTNAFFVCQDGNMGKRESLLLTSLNTEEEVKACRESSVIKIFSQTVRYLIELDGKFVDMVEIKGTPCVKLAFPDVIAISAQARQFNRRRIAFSIDLPITIDTKNQKPFSAKVFDVAVGGCSFIRRIEEADLKHPAYPKGTVLKASLHSPDKTNNYEIPVSGVVRKIYTMRNRYNELVELIGVEFNLISTNARGDFNKLLRFIDDEFVRTRKETNPVIDRCVLEQEGLQGDYADVHQAVDSGDPDLMLSMLTIWRLDPPARRALVSGLIKIGMTRSGISSQLVSALQIIATIEWSSDADMLVEAIIERKHVASALKVLDIIPEDSANTDALIKLISMHGSPEKLLEAVRVCAKKPRIQQNLLPILSRTAPIKYLIEAYQYIPKDSPLLEGLLELILEKTKSTMELMPLIRSVEDVNSTVFLKLIQRFAKGAPIKELVKLLEIQVSDKTQVGEFLVTEIVARGKPEHILEAFDFVSMDSFSSVALAFGLARCGLPYHMELAMAKTETLPRAGIILYYASLKQALETPQGFNLANLTRALGLDKSVDENRAALAKVEREAKKLMNSTEDRLCKLSEILHGQVTGRLKRQ